MKFRINTPHTVHSWKKKTAYLIGILCWVPMTACQPMHPETTPAVTLPKSSPAWVLAPTKGVVGYAAYRKGGPLLMEEVAFVDAKARLAGNAFTRVETTTRSSTRVSDGSLAKKEFTASSVHTTSGYLRPLILNRWTDPDSGDLYLLVAPPDIAPPIKQSPAGAGNLTQNKHP